MGNMRGKGKKKRISPESQTFRKGGKNLEGSEFIPSSEKTVVF